MRLLPLLLPLAVGCQALAGLDRFGPATDDGAGGTTQGAGGMSSGGSTPQGGAGGATPTLTDEGLVVRYFIDERDGATKLTDAAVAPLSLTIDREGDQPELVGDPGARGARWASAGAQGEIFVDVADTKLVNRLDGNVMATIEAVLSLEAVVDGTRLVHFGSGTEAGRFSLRAPNMSTIAFYLGTQRATWNVDLGQPRLVVHLVYDATAAEPQDRARLFVDGVPRSTATSPTVGPGDAITIDASLPVRFHLGNRTPIDDQGQSAAGTIHYAAIYDVALPDKRIARHAAALLESDDL